jgi:hypothetical protein
MRERALGVCGSSERRVAWKKSFAAVWIRRDVLRRIVMGSSGDVGGGVKVSGLKTSMFWR